MGILNFFKNFQDNRNALYVVDRLLQVSLNEEALYKSRKIDVDLYRMLNEQKVNQEVIHVGLVPVIKMHEEMSSEFANFIRELSVYMEYDVSVDYVLVKTMYDSNAQKEVVSRMTSIRKNIIGYLWDKKLISQEVYEDQINREAKPLIL